MPFRTSLSLSISLTFSVVALFTTGAPRGKQAQGKQAQGKQCTDLVVRDAFDLVPPLAAQLACRLPRLHARVHRQHFVKPEELRDILFVLPKHIVVERTGSQGQLRRLSVSGARDVRGGGGKGECVRRGRRSWEEDRCY